VPLAHPEEPEHAAGRGAERDLGIGNSEAARGLPSLDVAQGSRRQADGDVQDVQAGAGEEPGDLRVGPAQPAGDPRADGEQLRRVGDAGAGAVDQLPPAFQHLLRGGLEQLLLAVEVVVERPEADVGLLGDLGDARPVPAALGDQPHGGVDEGLPGRALRRSSRDTLGAPAAGTASAITSPPAVHLAPSGHAGWSSPGRGRRLPVVAQHPS
jgi:hypothetical protein